MELRWLLQRLKILEMNVQPCLDITGIACDSRQVRPGSLFVAVCGTDQDGNQYIPQALGNGAVAVVTAHRPGEAIPYILVDDDRLALAQISARFYNDPGEKLKVIGVTGTNGKSSVAWMLMQVLEICMGEKVGLIGTVENRVGPIILPAQNTTPSSCQLQQMLAQMVTAGCRYAVMEVSSHGLHQQRTACIRFAAGAFTNLTEDHLDYHGTMESYAAAKAMLFASCDMAVLNGDDPWYSRMKDAAWGRVLTCSAQRQADLWAKNIECCADGVSFTAVMGAESAAVFVPIAGSFTVYNALVVLGLAVSVGIPLSGAAAALGRVRGLRGRMEFVPLPGRPYCVMIDFAHTPDGLEKLLSSVRQFCKGRLIVLFGCGGNRDRQKRPLMGAVATELADLAVITSDNPRTEDPKAIILDILQGVKDAKNYVVLENREEAIQYTMDIGKKDDIIVLCGKGHEQYQQIGSQRQHFDEREILRKR